jgi:hypothetical protein
MPMPLRFPEEAVGLSSWARPRRVAPTRGTVVAGWATLRLGSIYRHGRSPLWVKVKNPNAPAVEAGSRGRLGALKTQLAVVPRKTPVTLQAEISALLAQRGLGSRMLVLDDKDIVLLLKAAIEQEGSISAFAKRHGIQRSYLSHVVNGKRPVSGPLVKALGLRKVYTSNA